MNPEFAVVGHPNKGKSSIVSTLAQNDSVAISTRSGTTKQCQEINITIGRHSYSLIDTPGFQRPVKVLNWLQQQASTADQRNEAVRAFLNSEDCKLQFPDEIQLLTPIMNGAAIIYVVDGSRPYGPEYEAEMEILRWTGQASLALINPIENENYIDQWQQALGQYFKVVKVFNAMQAEQEKQLSILEAFSTLREDWKNSLTQLVRAHRERTKARKKDSADLLANLLTTACFYQLSQSVLTESQAEGIKPVLEQQFFANLSQIETDHHESLKSLLAYHNLESIVDDLPDFGNLFDTEKWVIWGLNKKQLTMAAAMAGAAAGALLDLGLAGSSLFLGALGGGVVGATGAWFGADKIAGFKLEGLNVGGYLAQQGPIRNRNFPYVLLGRFLHLEELLQSRTHAQRETINVNEGKLQERIGDLNEAQQKSLHKAMERLSKQKNVEDLPKILQPLLFDQNSRHSSGVVKNYT
ncbi:MAG: DUF3482 domain-containing protein [Pseudohongiellaceae bacterium]